MGRVTDYKEFAAGGPNTNADNYVYRRQATYNTKSQVTQDIVTARRSDGNFVTTTDYDYNLEGSTAGVYDGAYQGGVVTHQQTFTNIDANKNGSFTDYSDGDNHKTSGTWNTYAWWDSALTAQIHVDPNINDYNTVWDSYYEYGANGQLTHVNIDDGQPRELFFVTDAGGQVMQRRERMDTYDPGETMSTELHYTFGGIAVGDVGNDGTSLMDYAASIAEHIRTPATVGGPFHDGGNTSTKVGDFDQSYDPINGLSYESTSSRYTVQEGDTLESIAIQVWGDASFWYMIADANGLSASDTLIAGRDLLIPNKVHNSHNTSDVYRVYDPNEAIGDTLSLPKTSFGRVVAMATAQTLEDWTMQ